LIRKGLQTINRVGKKGMYVHFGCHSKMTIKMYYWVVKACFSLVYQRPLLLN